MSCSAICVADILSNVANSTVFGVCSKDRQTNGVDYLADLLTYVKTERNVQSHSHSIELRVGVRVPPTWLKADQEKCNLSES